MNPLLIADTAKQIPTWMLESPDKFHEQMLMAVGALNQGDKSIQPFPAMMAQIKQLDRSGVPIDEFMKYYGAFYAESMQSSIAQIKGFALDHIQHENDRFPSLLVQLSPGPLGNAFGRTTLSQIDYDEAESHAAYWATSIEVLWGIINSVLQLNLESPYSIHLRSPAAHSRAGYAENLSKPLAMAPDWEWLVNQGSLSVTKSIISCCDEMAEPLGLVDHIEDFHFWHRTNAYAMISVPALNRAVFVSPAYVHPLMINDVTHVGNIIESRLPSSLLRDHINIVRRVWPDDTTAESYNLNSSELNALQVAGQALSMLCFALSVQSSLVRIKQGVHKPYWTATRPSIQNLRLMFRRISLFIEQF